MTASFSNIESNWENISIHEAAKEHYLKPKIGLFTDGSVSYSGLVGDAVYWSLNCFSQFSTNFKLRGVVIETNIIGTQKLQIVKINKTIPSATLIKEVELSDFNGFIAVAFDSPVEIDPSTDLVGFNSRYNGETNVRFRYKLNCGDYGLPEYKLVGNTLTLNSNIPGAALNVQYITDSEYLSACIEKLSEINSDISEINSDISDINSDIDEINRCSTFAINPKMGFVNSSGSFSTCGNQQAGIDYFWCPKFGITDNVKAVGVYLETAKEPTVSGNTMLIKILDISSRTLSEPVANITLDEKQKIRYIKFSEEVILNSNKVLAIQMNNSKLRWIQTSEDYGFYQCEDNNGTVSLVRDFAGYYLGATLVLKSSPQILKLETLDQEVETLDQEVENLNSEVETLPHFYGPVKGFYTDGNLSGTGRQNDYSNWWVPNVYHLSYPNTITIRRIIALTDIGLFKAVKIDIRNYTIVEEIFETNITAAGVHVIDIPDTVLNSYELIGLYVKMNSDTPTCKFSYKLNQQDESTAGHSLYELYCSDGETPNQLSLHANLWGCKLCVQFLTQRDFTGNSLERFFNQYLSKISEIEEQITPAPIPTFQALPAQLIYNVYVDVPSLKPYQSRNYQACVYLDHLLKGLTSEIDIRFDNKKDRIQKNIPIYCSGYGKLPDGGSYVAIEGNNYKEYSSNHVIKVNGVTDKLSFTLKNRCVKSSVGKSFVPKVLCIGDSITHGILSETKEDNFTFSNTYVDICRQLFWKDQIDNNTQNDYKYVMIGTHTRDKQFTYKGNTYSFKVFHEGYSGYSASHFLTGQVAAFKKSDNEPFSIAAYISKYRTLDDNGNQLYFGPNQETTGTAGTNPGYWANGQLAKDSQNNQIYLGTMVSDVEAYSVCKPTHILINLGTNSPTSAEQWQQFVTLIHAEYPDIYIGLSIFDTSGTFFPSLHPKYSDSFAYWNQVATNPEVGASQNVSDHDKQWQTQNNLQTFFGKENEKVYVVPFFYCTSTVESSVVREFESPIEELVKDTDLRNVVYGWGGNYHINALAHAQCAYQLYGWIKWTLIS